MRYEGQDKAGRCLYVSLCHSFDSLAASFFYFDFGRNIRFSSCLFVVYAWLWRKHMHVMTHIAHNKTACAGGRRAPNKTYTTSESDKFDVSFCYVCYFSAFLSSFFFSFRFVHFTVLQKYRASLLFATHNFSPNQCTNLEQQNDSLFFSTFSHSINANLPLVWIVLTISYVCQWACNHVLNLIKLHFAFCRILPPETFNLFDCNEQIVHKTTHISIK